MVEGVHNFDDEMSVDSIDCNEMNTLKIVATSKDIEKWEEGDLLSGSQMWGCENLNRRIEKISLQYEEEGNFGFVVKTSFADMKEYFKRAKVVYKANSEISEVRDSSQKTNEQPKETIKNEVKKTEEKNDKTTFKLEDDNFHPSGSVETQVKFIDTSLLSSDGAPQNANVGSNGARKYLKETYWTAQQEREYQFMMHNKTSSNPKYSTSKGVPKYIQEVSSNVGSSYYRGDWLTVKFKTFEKCLDTDVLIHFIIRRSNRFFDDNVLHAALGLSKYQNDGRVLNTKIYLGSAEVIKKAYISMEVKCNNVFYTYYLSEFFTYNYSPQLVVTSPLSGQIFRSNETVNVMWEASDDFIKNYPIINLRVFECGSVFCTKTITQNFINLKVESKFKKFSFKADDYIFRDANMILQLDYNCNFAFYSWCDFAQSPVFSVMSDATNKDQVVMTEPEIGLNLISGNTLCVGWDFQEKLEDQTVTIELKKDVWGLDPSYYTGTIDLYAKGGCFTIPDVAGSTEFYTQLKYNCGVFFCKTIVSNYFAINSERKIKFESFYHDIMKKKYYITFAMQKLVTGKFSVLVKQKYPNFLLVQPELVGGQFYGPEYVVGQRYNVTFETEDQSFFKLYVLIKYDCSFGKFYCKNERSKLYSSELVYRAAWNDPTVEDKYQVSKTFVDFNCKNTVGYSDPLSIVIQELCKLSNKVFAVTAGFKITCEDCFVIAEYKLKDFEFDISFSGISKFTAEVDVDTKIGFNTISKFWVSLRRYQELQIFDLKQIGLPSFQFQIGSYTMSIGPLLNVYFVFDFDLTLLAQMSTNYTVNYVFSLSINSLARNPVIYNFVEKSRSSAFNILGSATFKAALGFKVNIGLGLGIESFNLDIYCWANNSLTLQVPPFIASNEYLVDNKKVDHFVNYDFDFTLNIMTWFKFLWISTDKMDISSNSFNYKFMTLGFFPTNIGMEKIMVFYTEKEFSKDKNEFLELLVFNEMNDLLSDLSNATDKFYKRSQMKISYKKEDFLRGNETYEKFYIYFTDCEVGEDLLYLFKKYILFGSVPENAHLTGEYPLSNLFAQSVIKSNSKDGCKMTDLLDENCRECFDDFVMSLGNCYYQPISGIENLWGNKS
ncbi:hypothetical protein EIN_361330 [Entamoeba invadens IP1]|uniref:Uncharacterized protein n=1 Tax=Entamoeba invadens IP1 TaxID=370355 RepID=A0A0A1U7Z6_ENTIV|nr:hypothetical protein EIN_361330 [Entamoeba invadens IP1]ELP90920.1 hypothetical protein EIN_361330 [Entamoeba invadens IP1]|eukprot:XP_004257691.1 hypothetical protein EIN_361330 [Entamoeba invadens IP1]